MGTNTTKNKKPKLGECCPALDMILRRDVAAGGPVRGFSIGTMFKPNGEKLEQREAVVYHFPKAKKDNTHPEFGYKKKFGDVTYAVVKHCPFCGAQIET